MCAAVRMMNDMLHLPASAGSCAEPVGTGSISRQLAEVAVAIFACMHVYRIPPYVVCHTARPELSHAFVHMSHKVGSLASVAGLAALRTGGVGGAMCVQM